jgi:hypothetical protein
LNYLNREDVCSIAIAYPHPQSILVSPAIERVSLDEQALDR